MNFKHLHYFWRVAKAGSIASAAAQLGLSPQTISGQITTLEHSLGRALFRQVGRRLELTEAGHAAMRYADEIFLLGEQLRDTMADPDLSSATRLTVGIADSVPKLVAYELLAPILAATPSLRLICHEGENDELIASLARHKLDLVLADRDLGHAPPRSLLSKRVAMYPIGLFAAQALLASGEGASTRQLIQTLPMLLPSKRSYLRARIDAWLEAEGFTPSVVGEFDDSALLTTFGGNGVGLFPAATMLAPMLARQYDAQLVTALPDIHEAYFAISTASRMQNPHWAKLLQVGD